MHWQELRGQSRGASLQSAGIFSASRACAEDIYQHCLRCDQVTRPWSCPVQARRESAGEGLSGETSGNDEDDQWEPCSPEARSEEHTSELQSLVRISYAVFCLKKKKQQY